jgi:hypothetical protein
MNKSATFDLNCDVCQFVSCYSNAYASVPKLEELTIFQFTPCKDHTGDYDSEISHSKFLCKSDFQSKILANDCYAINHVIKQIANRLGNNQTKRQKITMTILIYSLSKNQIRIWNLEITSC